ncbi:hypothetical protein HDV62DRAFT_214179 [Trichoderma sp. SZMC 28011]
MSGLLEGVLSGPRWRESWVSPQSVWLNHGSGELLELEKRIKQTRTYLEGREKRNRRRSVDRIEGQSENQRGVSQATRDSGRLRMSFEDRETSSLSYPGDEKSLQESHKKLSRIDRRSCDVGVLLSRIGGRKPARRCFFPVFFSCPRGDGAVGTKAAAKWSEDGGWRCRWAALGMYKVWIS